MRSVPVGFSAASVRRERTEFELDQHVAGGAEEILALLGQDQAAGMAMEEGDAEILLKRAHLPAHRRLAHVERLAGMGERAGLRGRLENAELVPVHSGRRLLRQMPCRPLRARLAARTVPELFRRFHARAGCSA